MVKAKSKRRSKRVRITDSNVDCPKCENCSKCKYTCKSKKKRV